MMENLIKDVRFAIKLLLKEKSFAAAALLTLALCIGANTAMFSVVSSILLKPLPYSDPHELVRIYNAYPNAGVERGANGVPDYYDRMELEAFESVALFETEGLTIGDAGRPERVTGLAVTPSLFDLLGVSVVAGRTFTAEEGETGNEQKAILSWGLWQEQYGGEGNAIGGTIRINDVAHTIVGVMPRDFVFENPEVKLWTPLAFTAEQRGTDARHNNNWEMIARLRDGATVERAQSDIDALNRRLDEELPQFSELLRNIGFRTVVANYQDDIVRDVRGTLWLLQAGVLLVLLIGCVNIANLVLVRSTARHRELATRAAIGAGNARIVRQLLTESVVLAVGGGALGVLVGWAAVRSFSAFAVENLPRGAEVGMDIGTIGVALAISAAAGLLFGAIPALRLVRGELSSVFREEGRSGTASRTTRALRGGLVIAQVSIAFALLVGAGLMLSSFARVMSIDPGFEPQNVLTASVSLPVARYPDPAAREQLTTTLLERLRALPGVTSAGATNVLPFSGSLSSSAVTAEGYVPEPGESLLVPVNSRVSDQYFESMSIEVVSGRGFTAGDVADAPAVAVVDRTLADHFWPGRDPIGQRITQGVANVGRDDDLVYRTIVGVVETVRTTGMTGEDPPGHYYVPLAQQPSSQVYLTIHSAVEPAAVTNAVRAALSALDPDLPLYQVRMMEERISGSLTTERTRMLLLAGFAALALLLAAIGLYGVLAYTVSQRSAEIGIRMALGGSARDVFALVMGQGARLVVAGLVLGVVGSLALSRLVTSMLYGVAPTDPTVYGVVLALLGITALAASAVPARRAMKVDPVVAMRES